MSDHDELIKAVLSADAGSVLTLNDYEKVKGRLKKKKTLLTRNKHKVNISSESVNCKQTSFPTDFIVYINETRSNIRRTTTVRETSFISLLSLLLFKNEELLCREVILLGIL
ncbi:transmembrane protein [Holotrichia oblita]|uniref:Transmembrane protein n=1 Tax=Holotrichia oblita TaxID=644536 RepID=A0ACB9TPE7_HOLOL|nr:transmembrane protein [Holotrichia oblita]